MAPIFVNMPGGALDSAGQGVAAAQGYRANEQRAQMIDQEAAQRSEKFALEKDIAIRSIELDEQKLQFEQEQLAGQQEAEADALVGMALESGADIGDGGKYREMLMRTSPQFRRQMATELGRSARVKAQQAEMDEIASTLDLTPETKALVEAGQLVDPSAIKRAQQKEKWKLAQGEFQEIRRASALEGWQAWTKDPSFDMPTEDDEAYDDVMTLLGEIGPGAATNAKVDYGMVMNQLRLLTTKGMREAARTLLEREMGGMDAAGMPKGTMRAATGNPGFRQEVYGQKAKTDRADANATMEPVPGSERAPGAPASTTTAAAPAAQGETQPTPTATKTADLKAPTQRLVSEDQAKLARTALANLGMKNVPAKGTPERAKLEAEIVKLEKEGVDAAVKRTTSKAGGHL